MRLFEIYTQEQLDNELKSKEKARRLAALGALAQKGRDFLARFVQKKVATGTEGPLVQATAEAGKFMNSAGPKVREAFRKAGTAISSAFLGVYNYFAGKAAEGKAALEKEGLGARAARAWVGLNTIISAQAAFLGSSSRIGIVDGRYGTLVLPTVALKINNDPGRYYLVDRYKAFSSSELKKAITNFSDEYGFKFSKGNNERLQGIIAKMILDRANGRYVKNRYTQTLKSLISNENWNKIRKGETTPQKVLARMKVVPIGGERVGIMSARYQSARVPSTAPQNSRTNVMSTNDIKAAVEALIAAKPNFYPVRNKIEAQARLRGATNKAHAYITKLQTSPELRELQNLYQARFNSQTRLENLLSLRSRRNYAIWHPNLRKNFENKLQQKLYSRASSFNSGNFDYQTLAGVVRAINSAETVGNIKGATTYVNSLKRAVNRLGTRVNSIRTNENKLRKISQAVGGSRRLTSLANSIRNAQGRLSSLRREENSRRRERGLAPLPQAYFSRGYNNGGRIPYYPQNVRPPSYGNVRPAFVPEPNRPRPGVVPVPPPLQALPAIPVNNRQRQAPEMRPENLLPPTEAAAVENAGGINKAINLVENAGGAANVAKTANILKNVGGNPNAAIAAGANAKNVKIVLQLGGANNALKVASAVPKLKKRRRSKKSKPKAPRVKELKKLIKFLGTKEELIKKLPNPENKEKKLTKNQVVAKITTHLLRRGKK